MGAKTARAEVSPVRQRTQYTCMATSMMMCLQANGVDTNEDEVNRVMGARPMKGAAWEDALACAQHYGMRATLTVPSTIKQLKAWTDQGIPVMIAWNPEGREWSHASVAYHVSEGPIETVSEDQIVQGEGPGLYVWVADPNIPHPDKTTRIVHEDVFYGKWYEKWPNYLVRRPACAIETEVTPEGRQVMASNVRIAKLADQWMNTSTSEQQQEITRTGGGRSPNQTGSSAMLMRQGLTPVDFMFGEALPHRRPIVMQGEELQDRKGNLWFFVGMDENGKALLAKTEREMKQMSRQLVEDRLHHQVVAAKRKSQPVTEPKDKNAPVQGEGPKRRNVVVQEMIERGGAGAGGHKNKGQRGTGQKGKGKQQRHPKHKQDLRRVAERVADRYLGTPSIRDDG